MIQNRNLINWKTEKYSSGTSAKWHGAVNIEHKHLLVSIFVFIGIYIVDMQ